MLPVLPAESLAGTIELVLFAFTLLTAVGTTLAGLRL